VFFLCHCLIGSSGAVAAAASMTPQSTVNNKRLFATATGMETADAGAATAPVAAATAMTATEPPPPPSPCFGCYKTICPNMRAVATVRRMCIRRFGMEALTQRTPNYKFNADQRATIYKIYQQQVSLNSIKHVPICGMLMAMDWFPVGHNDKCTQDLRDKVSERRRKCSFTDEGF